MSTRTINKSDVLEFVRSIGFDPHEIYSIIVRAGQEAYVEYLFSLDREPALVEWNNVQDQAVKFVTDVLGLTPEEVTGFNIESPDGVLQVKAQLTPFYVVGGAE